MTGSKPATRQTLTRNTKQGSKARRRETRRLRNELRRDREETKAEDKQLSTGLMSACAVKYALAISDPFNAPSGACIPDAVQTESFKFKVMHKGSFEVGTAGHGFICINPTAAVASDVAFIAKSQGTFTGNAFENSTATTGVGVAVSNSYFTSSQIGGDPTQMRYRIVAAGIRIAYRGTELDLAGIAFGIGGIPELDDLGTTYINTLGTFEQVQAVPVSSSRRWIRVVRPPMMADNDNSYATAFSGSPTATDIGKSRMGIGVSGATSGESFEYEVVVHLEVVGPTPGVSPSDYDPSGFAGVCTVAARKDYITASDKPNMAGKSASTHFLKKAMDWVSNGVSGAIRAVAPPVIAAAKASSLAYLATLIS